MPVCVGGEGEIAQNGAIGGGLCRFQDKNGRFYRIDRRKDYPVERIGRSCGKKGAFL